MKETITVLMKGLFQNIPIRTKSRGSFLSERIKYEMFRSIPFEPVAGVNIAVGNCNSYRNFRLGEEDLMGVVFFFNGDKASIVDLTEEQIKGITKWFENENILSGVPEKDPWRMR
jgi:hypothetical protein